MAPLHHKLKRIQLRQLWHSDPAAFVARYREAVGGDDLDRPPHSDASLAQMIQAIIAREDVDLSTTGIMRAIAA